MSTFNQSTGTRLGLLVFAAVVAPALLMSSALAQDDDRSSGVVKQGEVARWAEQVAAECGIFGKRYPAVDGVCYYPVDFTAEPGTHEIALYNRDNEQSLGWLEVEGVDFPEVELTLEDDSLINLEGEKLEQHQANREELREHVFDIEVTEPRFSLPLDKPADALPPSEDDFASLRNFNDGAAESRHSGRDFPVAAGQPLTASADGTVLLAADHLLTGKAVYVDHGNGLVTMYFHLSELDVSTGDEVSRGDVLGKVGNTGRSTGPHLHMGVRWLEQRIDPVLLFDDPALLATVSRSGGERGRAGRNEPPEDGEDSEAESETADLQDESEQQTDDQ